MRLVILKFLYFIVIDVTADVNHLYVKRIHLVGFSYVIIDDKITHLLTHLDGFIYLANRCAKLDLLILCIFFGTMKTYVWDIYSEKLEQLVPTYVTKIYKFLDQNVSNKLNAHLEHCSFIVKTNVYLR
jgi:hypothetical protein